MTPIEKIGLKSKQRWANPVWRAKQMKILKEAGKKRRNKARIVKYPALPNEEEKIGDPFKKLKKVARMLGYTEIVVSTNGGGVTFR